MASDEVDAEELFQRIQRNLALVEEEDGEQPEGDDEDAEAILKRLVAETDDTEISEGTTEDKSQTEAKKDNAEPEVKEEQKETVGNQEVAKKKIYQFTEVSGGTKRDVRRFSQSKQFTGLQAVPTHNPLLRSQDVSAYKPSTEKLDELLKRIQKRNQQKLEVMSSHQKNIFKRFLQINMLSEEIMKKSDEHLQLSTSRTAEDKMREFEIVEVSILKYKTHLTYMTQRLEIIEEHCDKTVKELISKYEAKALTPKQAPPKS